MRNILCNMIRPLVHDFPNHTPLRSLYRLFLLTHYALFEVNTTQIKNKQTQQSTVINLTSFIRPVFISFHFFSDIVISHLQSLFLNLTNSNILG